MLLKCLSQLPPYILIGDRVRELPIGQMRTRKYAGRIFAQWHKWHNEDGLSDNAFDRASNISKQHMYNSTLASEQRYSEHGSKYLPCKSEETHHQPELLQPVSQAYNPTCPHHPLGLTGGDNWPRLSRSHVAPELSDWLSSCAERPSCSVRRPKWALSAFIHPALQVPAWNYSSQRHANNQFPQDRLSEVLS